LIIILGSDILEIGKLAGNNLKKVILNKIDHFRSDVLIPAGEGEDSAVVDLGDSLLVVSSDPITGAEKNAGFIAVNVSCNDIAAAGAEPFGIQVVFLLPPSLGEDKAEKLMQEIVETAKAMDIEVLGGHTEITDLVQKPIITVTALGKAVKEELTSSASAEVGDRLYITKGMGIEGCYILANDYEDYLLDHGVSKDSIGKASNYLNLLSVIPESRIARKNGVKAMHDVTEGGVYGAVAEMASASGLGYVIEADKFQVKDEIADICKNLNIDPAGLISSGAMLIAAASDNDLESIFAEKGIQLIEVGRIIEKGSYIEKNRAMEEFSLPVEDELWKFIKKITNNS
jgi:hydrogenase maturation factor